MTSPTPQGTRDIWGMIYPSLGQCNTRYSPRSSYDLVKDYPHIFHKLFTLLAFLCVTLGKTWPNWEWRFTPHSLCRLKVTRQQPNREAFPMVQGRKTNLAVELSNEDRVVLETWQRSTIIKSGLSRRGRIILMMADGDTISHISRTVGIRRRFIYKWVNRFVERGIHGLNGTPGRSPNGDSCVVV